MNLKSLTPCLALISILLVSIATSEVVLCIRRGPPPLDPDPPQFKYRYEEIYGRFFRKTHLPDGAMAYKAERNQSSYCIFPAYKDKNTRRIFVIGGSVAYMFNSDLSLVTLLNKLIPETKFELIGCGMGCYDSYRESIIEEEVLNYSPDLIILMSGNNEFYEPVKINLMLYHLNALFRKLWVYRDLQGKINPFVKTVKFSSKKYLINFDKNLRIMVRRAKKKNIPIALCTLPVDFRDTPPFGFPLWQDKQFFSSWLAFEKGDFNAAAKELQQFIAAYPQDAFGHYFLAKSYEKLGDYPQAQFYYMKALDFDANPGDRCSPQRNKIIRRICSEEDVILVDLEKTFIDYAPNGLVGGDLFIDNCHWWEDYYYLIRREIIYSIVKYNRAHSGPVFAPMNRWQNLSLLATPESLKTNLKTNMREKVFRKLLYSISALHSKQSGLVEERSISYIQQAYNLDADLFKDDFYLKEIIFNKLIQNWWTQDSISDFDKDWPIFLMHAGEAFRRLKLFPQAIEYFNKAINLNSDLWFAYLGRGLAYYDTGQINKAKIDLELISKGSFGHPLIDFYREYLGI